MNRSIMPVITDTYLPMRLAYKSILHQMPEGLEFKDIKDKTYEIEREIAKYKKSLPIEDRFIIASLNAFLEILLKYPDVFKDNRDVWEEVQAFETFLRRYIEIEETTLRDEGE